MPGSQGNNEHEGAVTRSRKNTRKSFYTRVPTVPVGRRSVAPQTAAEAVALQRIPKADLQRFRLSPEQLRWTCDSRELPFRTTREVSPLRGWLGQGQALRSLKLGLTVSSPGYNVFICGLNGTDALREIEEYVRSLRFPRVDVPDLVYVQNFEDPQRPRLLRLPPRSGPRFQKSIHEILRKLHRTLEKMPEKRWRARAREVLSRELPRVERLLPQPDVRRWLQLWRKSILKNVHHAMVEDYEVNVLRRSRSGRGVPVVSEKAPNPSNLLGWIGRRAIGDQPPVPHFSEIRAGSILQADGGVLIVSASDFYSNPNSWALLKGCLKYGVLQIEDGDGQGGARGGGLRPDPVPVHFKILLLGDYSLYDHLFDSDGDFCDLFKIRVDFDSEVNLTSRVLKREYPAFISRVCAESQLRPLNAGGVARIVEFAMRRAERQGKVTTQTWVIKDLLREADYWAATMGRSVVTGADVQRAVDESNLRLNLVETKISEMISEGTILIATSGSRVGQVNGLAVYDMGDYLFAKPSRITAETSCGHGGIINIERESGLSGRSHDKGVQILSGYLRSRFAQHRPLNLTASVCFEQSYAGVDGDSASATEIYAILSSLAGLPIRQDIAVTGSLNQKGDIQPIGGVNEKIEGFYDCVHAGRPTGKEGVIVPRKNVKDLMLRDDIVRSVRRGTFHIFAIDTVEQGFEILTGIRAGRRRGGRYTPGTSFALVDQRLDDLAEGLRHYQGSNDG